MLPSALMTSQSIMICRSPIDANSTHDRSDRPTRRWISWDLPDGWPTVRSRRFLEWVDPGSIAYSQVIQPRPVFRLNIGTRSPRLAEHITRVSPTQIKQEPSACVSMPVSIVTSRIWFKSLPDGRMFVSLSLLHAAYVKRRQRAISGGCRDAGAVRELRLICKMLVGSLVGVAIGSPPTPTSFRVRWLAHPQHCGNSLLSAGPLTWRAAAHSNAYPWN